MEWKINDFFQIKGSNISYQIKEHPTTLRFVSICAMDGKTLESLHIEDLSNYFRKKIFIPILEKDIVDRKNFKHLWKPLDWITFNYGTFGPLYQIESHLGNFIIYKNEMHEYLSPLSDFRLNLNLTSNSAKIITEEVRREFSKIRKVHSKDNRYAALINHHDDFICSAQLDISPTGNCQVSSIVNYNLIADSKKERIERLKILCAGSKALLLIDIKQEDEAQVTEIFGTYPNDNILSRTAYTSTNNSDMILYLVRTKAIYTY